MMCDRVKPTNKLEKVFIESQVTIINPQEASYQLGQRIL